MRTSALTRKTKETDITVGLKLDGAGNADVATGVGFFDHMLTAFAFHGGFDLTVKAEGDLHVDAHHTVEDTGILLGEAFYETLGDKAGIERFGFAYVPMDDALARAAVDVSGRACFVCGELPDATLGGYPAGLTADFFNALCHNADITLHIEPLYGRDPHHLIEAVFKAAARALRQAVAVTGTGVPSTKGLL